LAILFGAFGSRRNEEFKEKLRVYGTYYAMTILLSWISFSSSVVVSSYGTILSLFHIYLSALLLARRYLAIVFSVKSCLGLYHYLEAWRFSCIETN